MAIYAFGLIAMIFIPESPKWLYSAEKYQECYASVQRMAKLNRKNLSEKATRYLKGECEERFPSE
jgi:endonuclease YncB( thermonuclease family)